MRLPLNPHGIEGSNGLLDLVLLGQTPRTSVLLSLCRAHDTLKSHVKMIYCVLFLREMAKNYVVVALAF